MRDWLKQLFRPLSKPEFASPPGIGAEPTDIAAGLRARFGHLSRPAVQLRAAKGDGFGRLGGLPSLPPHLDWPRLDGKPMAFLAQVDLATVHAALPSFLPADGRLYFFYDQDQSAWGFDPTDAASWRVLHFVGDAGVCSPRAAPDGLAPDRVYREKHVEPRRIDLLPAPESLGAELAPEESWGAYHHLRSAPFDGESAHQMLGYPSPIQNPDMELDCQLASNGLYCGDETGYNDPRAAALKTGAADWKLLLQLDSDEDTGWMWGDVGTIYFWVREQDAGQGDFSKVWMILECS